MKIEFKNKEINSEIPINPFGGQAYDSLKKFTIEWRFQCDDIKGKPHYYRANLYVKDSNEPISDPWTVEMIG